MRQKKKKIVNLVTPVAQVREMAKWTLKRERKNDEVNIDKNAFVPRISQKKIQTGTRGPRPKMMKNCHRDQLDIFGEAPRDASLKSKNG